MSHRQKKSQLNRKSKKKSQKNVKMLNKSYTQIRFNFFWGDSPLGLSFSVHLQNLDCSFYPRAFQWYFQMMHWWIGWCLVFLSPTWLPCFTSCANMYSIVNFDTVLTDFLWLVLIRHLSMKYDAMVL